MDFSFLGPSAASVVVVLAFLKYMSEDSKRRDSQHDETIKALKKNTAIADKVDRTMRETVTYLKHRNGAFEKLIKEQPQIHQLVKEHFEEENK